MIPFPFQFGGMGLITDPTPGVPAITLNPADKSATITLSSGNLTGQKTSGGTGHVLVRATVGKSSGKWYWEVVQTSTMTNSREIAAITQASVSTAVQPGSSPNGWGYNGVNGFKYNNNVASAYGATFNTGDVIGVALNLVDGQLTFYKNNTSQGVITGIAAATWFPTIGFFDQTGTAAIRLKASAQTYSPPTGFLAYDT